MKLSCIFCFSIAINLIMTGACLAAPKLSVRQGSKQCNQVGVKGTGQFISASKLACFKSRSEAKKAGLVDAFTASFKEHEKHPVSANLLPSSVVPPSNATTSGECTGVMDHDTLKLRLVCSSTIAAQDFWMAHIQFGAEGEPVGPLVCMSPSTGNPVVFDCNLSVPQHAALHSGNLNVVMHSFTYSHDGEIRGQLEVE